jgi:hypothetical protein
MRAAPLPVLTARAPPTAIALCTFRATCVIAVTTGMTAMVTRIPSAARWSDTAAGATHWLTPVTLPTTGSFPGIPAEPPGHGATPRPFDQE